MDLNSMKHASERIRLSEEAKERIITELELRSSSVQTEGETITFEAEVVRKRHPNYSIILSIAACALLVVGIGTGLGMNANQNLGQHHVSSGIVSNDSSQAIAECNSPLVHFSENEVRVSIPEYRYVSSTNGEEVFYILTPEEREQTDLLVTWSVYEEMEDIPEESCDNYIVIAYDYQDQEMNNETRTLSAYFYENGCVNVRISSVSEEIESKYLRISDTQYQELHQLLLNYFEMHNRYVLAETRDQEEKRQLEAQQISSIMSAFESVRSFNHSSLDSENDTRSEYLLFSSDTLQNQVRTILSEQTYQEWNEETATISGEYFTFRSDNDMIPSFNVSENGIISYQISDSVVIKQTSENLYSELLEVLSTDISNYEHAQFPFQDIAGKKIMYLTTGFAPCTFTVSDEKQEAINQLLSSCAYAEKNDITEYDGEYKTVIIDEKDSRTIAKIYHNGLILNTCSLLPEDAAVADVNKTYVQLTDIDISSELYYLLGEPDQLEDRSLTFDLPSEGYSQNPPLLSVSTVIRDPLSETKELVLSEEQLAIIDNAINSATYLERENLFIPKCECIILNYAENFTVIVYQDSDVVNFFHADTEESTTVKSYQTISNMYSMLKQYLP